MKKIRIKEISINGKVVAIQIIEQTHRERQFGEEMTIGFSACGFTLRSSKNPEAIHNYKGSSSLDFNSIENGLCVRGWCKERDNEIVPVFSDFWLDKLRACVKSYNKKFRDINQESNEPSSKLKITETILE